MGGDIASASLARDDAVSSAMFARSLRTTNCSNLYDKVLEVSNAKRLGLRPRVGRVGVPENAHDSVVDVDYSAFFDGLDPKAQPCLGTLCRSWHIGNRVFARDLACVPQGGVDRAFIPTRRREGNALVLRDAPRAVHESRWRDG